MLGLLVLKDVNKDFLLLLKWNKFSLEIYEKFIIFCFVRLSNFFDMDLYEVLFV